jgi:YtkA-like
MQRKSIGIFAVVGLAIVGILAFVVFFVIPRFQSMMGGSGQVTGGLTAVSAEGIPVPLPVDSAKLPENTAAQKVGNLNVTLALSPYPPAGFQQASYVVTLKDENGQPVSDASVMLDLTMPAMPMPSNQVVAKYTDSGLYQGAGRFTMRGLWRIVVIIQRGGEKITAYFDVGL